MNAPHKWFDVDAELQKIRDAPAKPAKAAKEEEGNFSNLSNFSRGEGEKSKDQRPSILPSQSQPAPKEEQPFFDDARNDIETEVVLKEPPQAVAEKSASETKE